MRPWLKIVRSPLFFGCIVSALVCFAVVLARGEGKLQFLELKLYDLFLDFSEQPGAEDPRIVIVSMTESDIRQLGEWPLPDSTLSVLLKRILEQGPAVVGLDLYRDIPVSSGREELVDVLIKNENIIGVTKLGDPKSPGVPGPYMLKGSERVGFNDLVVDPDGVVRRGLLYLDDGRNSYSSFALLVALRYLAPHNIAPRPDPLEASFLRLGKTTFVPFEGNDGGYVNADAAGYQFLLDFSGIRTAFRSTPLSDVLSGKVPRDLFSRKIVLIGSKADSLKDSFVLPVKLAPQAERLAWGVEVHACIASQILHCALNGRKPTGFVGERTEFLFIILCAFAGSLLALRASGFVRSVLLSLGLLCAILLMSAFAFWQGVWAPAAAPSVAALFSSVLTVTYLSQHERTQRALLMRLFSTHLSKDVAELIWEKREEYLDGNRPRPQELTVTVLFTDLQGFTALAEGMDVRELIDWLNEYMTAMTDIVIDSGGIVNKYIGDAILGLFGVPVPRNDEELIRKDAVNAVTCAMRMGRELDRMNERWRERNHPTVRMRVGIYTGRVMVGCIGSADRVEYTVIGDTVNIASRLESFDKDYDSEATCRILVGDATVDRLDGEFPAVELGSVPLKGREGKIRVFQIKEQEQEQGI